MKKLLQTLGGLVLGTLAAFTFLHIEEIHRASSHPRQVILPETAGAIGSVVIQFSSLAPEALLRPFRDYLTHVPDDLRVFVACKDQSEFSQFNELLHTWGVRRIERFRCVETGKPITIWSKDRFIVATRDGMTTLLVPESPHLGDILRQNDYDVAFKLAEAAGWRVRRLPMMFDGGDVYATDGLVFANRDLVEKNVPHRFENEDELIRFLEEEFGKKVVMLKEGTPAHHAGMFITPVDDHTVFAGDPSLAYGLADIPGADFSDDTVQEFREVIAQLEHLGFRVIRLPLVPTGQEKVYFTYNNAIVEYRGSEKIAYLPAYGIEVLDRMAAETWGREGFSVKPIYVRDVHTLGGTIHCMVNVLERK